jgi:hypothetical protein
VRITTDAPERRAGPPAPAPDVELAGPVERLAASFVSGIKHLPLRYRLVAH